MKNNNQNAQVAHQLQQQHQQASRKQNRAVAETVKERLTQAPTTKQVDQYLLMKEAQASAARSSWNKSASEAQKQSRFKQSRQQNYSASSMDDDRHSLQGWSEAERDIDARAFAAGARMQNEYQRNNKSQNRNSDKNGKPESHQSRSQHSYLQSQSYPQRQQLQQQQNAKTNLKASSRVAEKPNPKRQHTNLTLADIRRQPTLPWEQNGLDFDAFAALAATPSRNNTHNNRQHPQQRPQQERTQQHQKPFQHINTQHSQQRSQPLRSPTAADSPKHVRSPYSLDQIRNQPQNAWEQNGLALDEFASFAAKSQQSARSQRPQQDQQPQQQRYARQQRPAQQMRPASAGPRRTMNSPTAFDSPKHVSCRLTLNEIRRMPQMAWEQSDLDFDNFASFAATKSARPAQQQRSAQRQQQQQLRSASSSFTRRAMNGPTAADSPKHVSCKFSLSEIRHMPQQAWEQTGLEWETFVSLNIPVRGQNNKGSRPTSRTNSSAAYTAKPQQQQQQQQLFQQQLGRPAQQPFQQFARQAPQPARQPKAINGFFDIFELLSGR